MIFNEFNETYGRTIELFRVWLNRYGVDIADRKVRSEVEELMGEIFEGTNLSKATIESLKEEWREDLRNDVWEDVKVELRDEIESELRETIEAEYEEKKNEEVCSDD